MSGQFSRRQMLFLALAAGGVAPQVTLADTPPAKVSEKDSLAVALGYVADSKHIDKTKSPTYQAGSSCSNCSWYQGKPGDAAGGSCTFFPGKNVDADGWCRMWNKKA